MIGRSCLDITYSTIYIFAINILRFCGWFVNRTHSKFMAIMMTSIISRIIYILLFCLSSLAQCADKRAAWFYSTGYVIKRNIQIEMLPTECWINGFLRVCICVVIDIFSTFMSYIYIHKESVGPMWLNGMNNSPFECGWNNDSDNNINCEHSYVLIPSPTLTALRCGHQYTTYKQTRTHIILFRCFVIIHSTMKINRVCRSYRCLTNSMRKFD